MTWYYIESDEIQPVWVEAETELGAMRIHATRYGDDQTLKIEDSREDLTLSVELEGSEPPFRSLQETEDGDILIHEKRVNQAGSKGIYQLVYSP